jgi:type I restriction enzyme S subunit
MTKQESWMEATLEDCMEAIIDYRGKTPKKKRSGIPLITAKVIKEGRIEPATEFIDPDDYNDWMTRGLPSTGDVLLTTEAPLGEVAQLSTSDVALAQRVITLRGKQGVLNNSFLKYLLRTAFVQEQLKSRASGSTVSGIKQSELRKVLLRFPSYTEQVRIASILGSLDDKIELNRRMNATLESMAQAIFKSWFIDFDPVHRNAAARSGGSPVKSILPDLSTDFDHLFPHSFEDSELGKVPSGWEVKAIQDVVEVVGGGTPNTKNPEYWQDGSFAWATPKDLSQSSSPILLNTERKLTQKGVERVSSGLLESGTVLMSSRAPIGYLALANVPVAINQGFIAIKPGKAVSNYFMLNWCRENLDLIRSRASGTTFLEISKASFRPIPIVEPAKAVVRAFDQIVSDLYFQIASNEQESIRLMKTLELLIPLLLTPGSAIFQFLRSQREETR